MKKGTINKNENFNIKNTNNFFFKGLRKPIVF